MRAPCLVLTLALTAAGCATPVSRPTAPAPRSTPQTPAVVSEDQPPAATEPTARAAGPRINTASVTLLDASRSARANGDYDAATQTVERALTIDPNNASLWIELAELKATIGDEAQARELARKALTLAGNDRSIAARANRLL